MVYLYPNDPWEQDEFDTRYQHHQQPKPRLQPSTLPTRPRQSTFKRQDRPPFQPKSYKTYYMDKEEEDIIYEQPFTYCVSPENIPDDMMLDNDYDMNSAASWNRRPRRIKSLANPNLELNDHYGYRQQDINRGHLPTRRQRRNSYISPHSPPVHKDSNRYYMETDYNYDQDDMYYARSGPSHITRRNSLQHHRHDSSHWVKPKVMGPTLHQHRMDQIDIPPAYYSGQMPLQPPPILSMPPPMITLPPPPLGIAAFPGMLPPFHPMMMMPQPTPFFTDTKPMPTSSTTPSSPPSDKVKSPSSEPVDLNTKSTPDTSSTKGLVPLTRSLSLGTSQPVRRSLFGNLFNSESKSSDSSPSLIPVQDLSTQSLSRKQSLSLEKKAKALSHRSYIWCYRIKPSVLIMQPSNCWFAMTPKNQIKLDPYICFYLPNNTVARADNLPTLITLEKEPKLTGSVTAMPQAKIARVYPSIFSSSNYIELVLDCLPADSQFVVRSD